MSELKRKDLVREQRGAPNSEGVAPGPGRTSDTNATEPKHAATCKAWAGASGGKALLILRDCDCGAGEEQGIPGDDWDVPPGEN